MRRASVKISLILSVGLIMIFCIWGPELLSKLNDKRILGEFHTQRAEMEQEGYRYALDSQEKLYLLSKCLSSQRQPESEHNAFTRTAAEYPEETGAYAFIVNHRGPSEKEITSDEIYEVCNRELVRLQELGILPDTLAPVDEGGYQAVLYSGIDVLEPRNHLAVWKLTLPEFQKNTNRQNRLIDACIDGANGKIYEFYARTELAWEEVDPDGMIKKWSEYMGLELPREYQTENPLLETTPYFKKYEFSGKGDGKTIVTIGFYEGINEVFLKVSK